MAELHLPATLPSLFEDLPRTLEVEAGTVSEAIDRLDQRWPGMRDRLCEPGPQLAATSTSTSTASEPCSRPGSSTARVWT